MRLRIVVPSILVALIAFPGIARADLTGFFGATMTPSSRAVKGFAFGAGALAIGFEFEYAHTNEDLTDLAEPAPELHTYMFNGLVQTPFAIAGFQPYGTAGYVVRAVEGGGVRSAARLRRGAGVRRALR